MNKENIVLSVIVTVYNLEDYIEDCIVSILKQATNAIELIIVDDGSSDGSAAIIRKLHNDRLVILRQNNSGVSAARNYGLTHARGQYIFYIDGDDLIAPNAIDLILAKIKSTRADILSTGYVKFTNSKRISNGYTVDHEIVQAVESENAGRAIEELIKNSIFLPNVSTNIFKRILFEKNSIAFDDKLSNNEDLDCGMRLYLTADKIAVISEPLYYYRQLRRGSATDINTKKTVESSLAFIQTWTSRISSLSDQDAKIWLLDYLAYQYLIILGRAFMLSKSDGAGVKKRLAAHKNLLDSRLTKNTIVLGKYYDLFGFNSLGQLLGFILRFKKALQIVKAKI